MRRTPSSTLASHDSAAGRHVLDAGSATLCSPSRDAESRRLRLALPSRGAAGPGERDGATPRLETETPARCPRTPPRAGCTALLWAIARRKTMRIIPTAACGMPHGTTNVCERALRSRPRWPSPSTHNARSSLGPMHTHKLPSRAHSHERSRSRRAQGAVQRARHGLTGLEIANHID